MKMSKGYWETFDNDFCLVHSTVIVFHPFREESSSTGTSSLSGESEDSLGSLNAPIDVEAQSDGSVPVHFLSEDGVHLEWRTE